VPSAASQHEIYYTHLITLFEQTLIFLPGNIYQSLPKTTYLTVAPAKMEDKAQQSALRLVSDLNRQKSVFHLKQGGLDNF
jgi:hypothetical protein